jgi:hypothetical protein
MNADLLNILFNFMEKKITTAHINLEYMNEFILPKNIIKTSTQDKNNLKFQASLFEET